ncbi:glyoxalase superfamily protein [Cohnella lupini]|uniref:Bleomycin resistance protein n=1 Tax=Cohnella lupini TaxID=1294267 RepID=A0A3D9HZ11_9BACL|nr:glyoxalase superfamily protein [Cohnella lupini]RED54713.1 hypothetical protein DFP95_12238 [Cohnella lupini]
MDETEYSLGVATPVLRIMDEPKAREFYVDFLGYRIDWEHRFEEDMPLYMQISQGSSVLHLSEHYGDSMPGAALRIEIRNIQAYHKFLSEKKYKYARPGVEQAFGSDEIRITDPFGNRITFYERVAEAGES